MERGLTAGRDADRSAQEAATSSEVLREQLPLALALRPDFAVVSAGTREAAGALAAVATGGGSFLVPLLADCEEIVRALRAVGAGVLLVRPPSLDSSPAAWLRFGRARPANTSRAFDVALRRMGRVAERWSGALAALAQRHGAAFADLSRVYDACLASCSPLAGALPGLPPQCGGSGDLFADPLRLSWYGAQLAAALLEDALDPQRRTPRPRARGAFSLRIELSPPKEMPC